MFKHLQNNLIRAQLRLREIFELNEFSDKFYYTFSSYFLLVELTNDDGTPCVYYTSKKENQKKRKKMGG